MARSSVTTYFNTKNYFFSGLKHATSKIKTLITGRKTALNVVLQNPNYNALTAYYFFSFLNNMLDNYNADPPHSVSKLFNKPNISRWASKFNYENSNRNLKNYHKLIFVNVSSKNVEAE